MTLSLIPRFPVVDELHNFHNLLLAEIETRMKKWTEQPETQMIGDIYLKFSPFFKIYSQYCKVCTDTHALLLYIKNYDKSNSQLIEASKRKNVAAFLGTYTHMSLNGTQNLE